MKTAQQAKNKPSQNRPVSAIPCTLLPLYLSAPDAVLLVRRKGLKNCIAGIADNIRADFLRWQDFDKSARVANHSKDGVIELMPISDATSYSFKYVNGHPKNTAIGLSTVMAFGVLADVATGAPTMLSELTLTTAMRTAATSALAAKTLARPESRVMALIGNGAQSEFQAIAFQHIVGIDTVRLFDIDPQATAKLMANLSTSGLKLQVCASTAEAVKGADIVTTVTADKACATILTADMIEPGMHINAVGGDCPGKTELAEGVLAAAKVFVEFTPQTRIEGDIQQMPADFAVTELWEVLSGAKAGRDSASQVTAFDSVGFALEDFSALRYMHDAALALGFGERLALIPHMADPKNLFGTLLLEARCVTEAGAGREVVGYACRMSIICLGSAIWDTIFKVESVPSAGIKVLPSLAVQAASGMATSAAVSMARLGGTVELWARLGNDEAGQRFICDIAREGVNTDFLRPMSGVATPFSSIIVDAAGERAVIPYYDPAMPADASWLPLGRVADAAAVLVDVRWVEGASALLQEARRCGVPAVLDADTAPLHVLLALVPLATHLLFSEAALQIYQPGLSPEAALEAVAATHDADVVGVTLGPAGALVWERAASRLLRVPAPVITAVDTLNAGDVWHGTFVWALVQGWPMDKVLRWANMAAAMKCEVFGGALGAPTSAALQARLAAWDAA